MVEKITESESLYNDLEQMTTLQLLESINAEDKKVAFAVEKSLSQIEALVNAAFEKLNKGGRLIYIGSGTSGRLGVVDASECPPTFGVSTSDVVGIIAGGDYAIRNAIENAEDSTESAISDLNSINISSRDFIIGISSSGTTPYVLAAMKFCNENGILTGCITNNMETELAKMVQFPIEVIVGPEFVTGSTRMKSGTSQKLVLNMVSTSLMIKLGRVKGNKMVDMKPLNHKLMDRGALMISEALHISYSDAFDLLEKYNSVRLAIENYKM